MCSTAWRSSRLAAPLMAAILAAALMIGVRPSPAAADPGFDVREVANGVFVHFGRNLALDAPGHDDIANIGFVVGTRCVAVIDSGGSVRIGRALRASIKQRTQVPICFVINTHVHVDHVLGNAAFVSDRPRFVGHSGLRAAMTLSRDFFLKQYANDLDQPPSQDQIPGPDLLVDDTLDLDIGARHLSLKAWPEAHTNADLTVLDLATGTLWAGDLLFRERLPALDGSAPGWLAVLDRFGTLNARLVIPGHGSMTADIETALAAERYYLTALIEGVRGELKSGNSLQHAIEQVAVAEKSKWLLWLETHPHNVARAYQQLEWE